MIQQLNTIVRRIRLLCRVAVLLRTNSSGKVQVVQVKTGADEILTDIEHREPYGYTSCPKQGAEALVIALGGNPSNSIAVVVGDRRYRLQGLEEGEVALYDDQQQQIILKRDGIKINAPLGYTINGNGVINGNTEFNGTVKANGKSIDDTHKHSGVRAGGDKSGAVS